MEWNKSHLIKATCALMYQSSQKLKRNNTGIICHVCLNKFVLLHIVQKYSYCGWMDGQMMDG